MTRGWGEVARVCRAEGALAIHFNYDGTSTLSFKVFNAEGCHLECCPGGGAKLAQRQEPGPPLASPAVPLIAAMALGSPVTLPSPMRLRRRATTATCPRALAVPGARQQRPPVAAIDLDGVGVGLLWPTVDDGVGGGACRYVSWKPSSFVPGEVSRWTPWDV